MFNYFSQKHAILPVSRNSRIKRRMTECLQEQRGTFTRVCLPEPSSTVPSVNYVANVYATQLTSSSIMFAN